MFPVENELKPLKDFINLSEQSSLSKTEWRKIIYISTYSRNHVSRNAAMLLTGSSWSSRYPESGHNMHWAGGSGDSGNKTCSGRCTFHTFHYFSRCGGIARLSCNVMILYIHYYLSMLLELRT